MSRLPMHSRGTEQDQPPPPFTYSPSQEFNGNDGKWSSFVVRIGTPPQNFRVLPSPLTGEILVPLVDGCSLPSDPADCSHLRGVYDFNSVVSKGFMANASSTWHELNIYDMDIRPDLNFNANGLYGLDNVGLMIPNSGGPDFDGQVVGAFANKRIFMGILGLGPKPANFSEFENPQTGLLQRFVESGKAPSRSWGYTAGAVYKTPKSLASLTIGGYDRSRLEPNNITFPFDPDDSRSLSLTMQTLSARETFNGSVNLQAEPTYMQIDYTVPHIWLPLETCDRFAHAFGLNYDNATDLYTVNATTHARLQQQNPSVTFGFGSTANPAERVNVVVPYSAFDLQAEWPIYPNATNYFPIRRAYNASQYTLGRTFMQEAYVIADYERGNFSVHQAKFPETTDKQDVVSIFIPKSSAAGNGGGDGAVTGGKKVELSKGAIAGIAVADACFLIFLIVLFIWFRRRRRRNAEAKAKLAAEAAEREKQQQETRIIQGELPSEGKFECDGLGFVEMDGLGFVELRASQGTRDAEWMEYDGRNSMSVWSGILSLYQQRSPVDERERDRDRGSLKEIEGGGLWPAPLRPSPMSALSPPSPPAPIARYC